MVDPMNPLNSLAVRASLAPLAGGEAPQAAARPKISRDAGPLPEKTSPSDEKATPETVREAAQEIEAFLKKTDTPLELQQESKAPSASYSDLAFQVDKDTGIAFFKVIDASTRKVIRQVPSEEVLAMARKLRELSGQADASGVLMNEEG